MKATPARPLSLSYISISCTIAVTTIHHPSDARYTTSMKGMVFGRWLGKATMALTCSKRKEMRWTRIVVYNPFQTPSVAQPKLQRVLATSVDCWPLWKSLWGCRRGRWGRCRRCGRRSAPSWSCPSRTACAGSARPCNQGSREWSSRLHLEMPGK